jgi:hypothetical protein
MDCRELTGISNNAHGRVDHLSPRTVKDDHVCGSHGLSGEDEGVFIVQCPVNHGRIPDDDCPGRLLKGQQLGEVEHDTQG